jgi:hypothetical protein
MDKNLNALFMQRLLEFWHKRHPDIPELMQIAFEEAKLKENADVPFEQWLEEIKSRKTTPL